MQCGLRPSSTYNSVKMQNLKLFVKSPKRNPSVHQVFDEMPKRSKNVECTKLKYGACFNGYMCA